MEGNLYTIRYRHGNRGVVTEFVEAFSQEGAEWTGQHYVNQMFNTQFIGASIAIVAREQDTPSRPVSAPRGPIEPDTEDSVPHRPKVNPTTRAQEMKKRADIEQEVSPIPEEERKRREIELADDENRARLLAEQEEAEEDARARARKADASESADPPKPQPVAAGKPKGK